MITFQNGRKKETILQETIYNSLLIRFTCQICGNLVSNFEWREEKRKIQSHTNNILVFCNSRRSRSQLIGKLLRSKQREITENSSSYFDTKLTQCAKSFGWLHTHTHALALSSSRFGFEQNGMFNDIKSMGSLGFTVTDINQSHYDSNLNFFTIIRFGRFIVGAISDSNQMIENRSIVNSI